MNNLNKFPTKRRTGEGKLPGIEKNKLNGVHSINEFSLSNFRKHVKGREGNRITFYTNRRVSLSLEVSSLIA